jgi:DNA-binding transcriptional ArsR family regulator
MSKKESQEQLESFRISDIDQVKALSHPLRMRIIETLAASDPMTTKQVADALGEKPTRLYHHVGLLQKAGLIRLTHTQQNRGTTEKYYEPIARQFRADADLFADESPENQKNAYRPMIRTIFDNTSSEMLRLVESNDFNEQLEEEGLLSYLEMHIPQKNVEVVRDKLKGVLDYLESLDESEFGDEELREMRLTVALYPLDRFE